MSESMSLEKRIDNVPTFDLKGKLKERYKSRGIVKQVVSYNEMQVKSEEKTLSEYPVAYGLWQQDDFAIDKKYRTNSENGERYMDTAGFVRYFENCRKLSKNMTGTEVYVDKEYNKENKNIKSPVSEIVSSTSEEKRPESVKEKANLFLSEWIRPCKDRKSTQNSKSKFSASALSAIVAVFVSLMLIVASSVMVGVETGKVSELQSELAGLEEEKQELQVQLDVKNDLVQIRDVAMNDLGMINEEFVSSKYVGITDGESIENFETENNKIDISTILSAIGFK